MVKETLDNLSLGNLQLFQAENGYRYSLDPVLLARFVSIAAGETVVDLGTGCGIIPLILAQISAAGSLLGIERQPLLADRAKRNVEINQLTDRVTIIADDIRRVADLLPAASCDLVVTNPPYRHLGSGRIAPNDERAAARHELAGGLADFVAAASWLLKNGGSFAVIYLVERLPELLAGMVAKDIEPKRLRMVHPRQGEAAKMVLLEGRKGGRPGLQVEKPLYIYKNGEGGRDYTEEVLQMYEETPG